MNRRHFISRTLTTAAAFGAGTFICKGQNSSAQINAPDRKSAAEVARRRGRLDLDLVFAFVRAGHNDLPKVKQMVAQEPNLVLAVWDWGGGDWETALGGAFEYGSS